MTRDYVIRTRRHASAPPEPPAPSARLRIQHRDTGCWLLIEGASTSWVPCERPDWATVFKTAEHAIEVTAALRLTQKDYRITSRLTKPT